MGKWNLLLHGGEPCLCSCKNDATLWICSNSPLKLISSLYPETKGRALEDMDVLFREADRGADVMPTDNADEEGDVGDPGSFHVTLFLYPQIVLAERKAPVC